MAANYNTISAAASNDQPSKPTSVTVKKIAVLAAAISFTLGAAAAAAIDNRSSRGDVTAFKSEITDANYGRVCDGENCELVDLRDAAQQQRFLLSDSCDSSRCADGHPESLATCADDDMQCRRRESANCAASGASLQERGEREKRFYGGGKDERRRTAFWTTTSYASTVTSTWTTRSMMPSASRRIAA